MSTLLFYKSPIALDRVAHRTLKVRFQSKGFNYAAHTNSIPVTAAEFGAACHEYPIVFITDEADGGLPVTLTGLRDAENLFVDQAGVWDASYIPAFVRRYPFILQSGSEPGSQTDQADFRVLVDSEADGYNDASGENLFDETGANSPMLTNVLDMLNQFSVAADQTAEFVRQLRKLDLLIPRVINAVTHSGLSFQMNGFSVVDEVRLQALDDTELLNLARIGYLASIHAHLISLSTIQKLLGRLERPEYQARTCQ